MNNDLISSARSVSDMKTHLVLTTKYISAMSEAIIAWLESVSIDFKRDSFEIERRLFGLTYRHHRGATSNVYPEILDVTKIGIRVTKVGIREGVKLHSLGRELSREESSWLLQQIREWLRLK